jgi:hypothetical protein
MSQADCDLSAAAPIVGDFMPNPISWPDGHDLALATWLQRHVTQVRAATD